MFIVAVAENPARPRPTPPTDDDDYDVSHHGK